MNWKNIAGGGAAAAVGAIAAVAAMHGLDLRKAGPHEQSIFS